MHEILLIILGFLSGLIFKPFLIAYSEKKGQNLATKEDIEEITEKIASVNRIIEIQKDSHLHYMSDRKSALLSFYDEASTFQYELMAVNFGDFPFDDGKSLYDYQVKFSESVTKIYKTYQRLVIYLPPNSDLLSVAEQITISVNECRKVVKGNFAEIKTTAVNEQLAYLSIHENGKEAYALAVHEANEVNSKYWRLMSPHMDTFINNYHNYLTTLNDEFQSQKINIKQ